MAVIIFFWQLSMEAAFQSEELRIRSTTIQKDNSSYYYRYYLATHGKTEIILTSFLRRPNDEIQSSVSRKDSIQRTVEFSDQDQSMGHDVF